jgi:hypothetical protein
MGETTTHPVNHATGDPANQPRDHPPNEKRGVPTWIALASAGTAIVAAVIAGFQVNQSGRQNTEAAQAQLVSLTTTISQQLTAIDTGTSTPVGASTKAGASTGLSTSAATDQGNVAQLTVEGQAGAVLIGDLNGNGVASIEYVEVGRALEYEGDTADAITYYKDALSAPPHDASTRAEALRFLGWAYYTLGQNVIAHQYMIRATKTFRGHPLETGSYLANTIAQGYLEDADWQIYIHHCPIGSADFSAVRRVMGPYRENVVNQNFFTTDTKEFISKCIGTG